MNGSLWMNFHDMECLWPYIELERIRIKRIIVATLQLVGKDWVIFRIFHQVTFPIYCMFNCFDLLAANFLWDFFVNGLDVFIIRLVLILYFQIKELCKPCHLISCILQSVRVRMLIIYYDIVHYVLWDLSGWSLFLVFLKWRFMNF